MINITEVVNDNGNQNIQENVHGRYVPDKEQTQCNLIITTIRITKGS